MVDNQAENGPRSKSKANGRTPHCGARRLARPPRLTSPPRRRADGTFEEIGWDTAIREVADTGAAVRDTHGGETIF